MTTGIDDPSSSPKGQTDARSDFDAPGHETARSAGLKPAQQAAIAGLSQQALGTFDLQSLAEKAMQIAADALAVEYATVHGIAAGGTASPGVILAYGPDRAEAVELARQTLAQAQAVLAENETVVVEDYLAQTRFSAPLGGRESAPRAGASVLIGEPAEPFGVFSIYSAEPRTFAAPELDFLKLVAATIAQVSQRLRAEGEIVRTREYYRSLLETSSDMIHIVDAGGVRLFESGATDRILGVDAGRAVGRSILDAIHPDDAPAVRASLRGLADPDRPVRFEARWRRADGSYLVCETIARSKLDPACEPFIVANTRDISERKRAEEERALLASIVESSYDAVYSVDLRGRVTSWNPGAEKLFGYSIAEIIGTDFGVAIPPRHAAQAREALAQAARGQGRHFETERIRKDGSIAEVAITIFPIRDSSGAVVRAGVISRDVTERNRALRDLAKARDEALESARLKSAFLSNMSHEIRTPLNVIMGFSEVIAAHLAGLGDTSHNEEIEAIRRNSRRLIATIQGILDLSKIEAGSFNINPKPVRLPRLIGSQVRDLSILALRKRLRLACRIQEPVAVWFDEYCLGNALMNLIQNAIKFTQAGEIEVRLGRGGDGLARIDVRDTGIGIRHDFLGTLFEPFTQASSGYRRRFEGSGLGLALTKKYLEMNGARLEVASEAGKGSVFSIIFPAACEIEAEDDDPGDSRALRSAIRPGSAGNRAHVILVEDDPDTAKYMQGALSGHYRVTTAASGKELRARLASAASVDLILMDLTLKGDEDGLMVTRDIRQHSRWKRIPIIAVTAYASEEDRDAAIAAGCDDYLSKPVFEAALVAKIDSLLVHAPGHR